MIQIAVAGIPWWLWFEAQSQNHIYIFYNNIFILTFFFKVNSELILKGTNT